MRAPGWVGAALGPPVGLTFFLFLLLVNAGRFRVRQKRSVPGTNLRYEQRIVTSAKCVPMGAVTFGQWTFSRYTWAVLNARGQRLLDHEMVHRYQVETLGWWRFLTWYGREIAVHGYAANSLEIDARDRAGV